MNDFSYRSNGHDLKYRPRAGNVWYWNFGENRGQFVLLGPYSSKEEAMAIGISSYGGFFDTHELQTRDKQAAASRIKAIRLAQGISDGIENPMGEALRRLRHKID